MSAVDHWFETSRRQHAQIATAAGALGRLQAVVSMLDGTNEHGLTITLERALPDLREITAALDEAILGGQW